MTRHIKAIIEKMYGPTGSVVVHAVIISMLLLYAGKSVKQDVVDVQLQMVEADVNTLDNIEDVLPPPDEIPPPDLSDIPPPTDMPDMADVPSVAGPGQGEVGAGNAVGPAGDIGGDIGALNVLSDVQGPLVMKGLYAGRSAGGRASALGQYGGKWGAYTEQSVIKALEWLKNHQQPDGSWQPKGDAPAMTGLALLAFLAHGETTASERYGATVEKAIRFLVSQQKENGAFSTIDQHGSYEHPIASYAISEAYGLTRIPSLKSVMEKATDVILKGQQPGGGWDYSYKKEARTDLSVMGWNIQALKSAYIAGAENPNLHESLEKAIARVKTFQNPTTFKFGYVDNNANEGFRPSMTGVAVLCMELTGHGEDKEAERGMSALKSADCDWAKPTPWPMYAWYYITQAKFHKGGAEWQAWNNMFAREFTKNQNEDGSWNTPSNNEEKSSGPVYATSLAALTLQVYYRFLPTYKPIKVEQKEEKNADEVSVEII